MKTEHIEHRNAIGSVRAKGGRKLGGLGIPFDVLSDDLGGFRERIAPGAFTDSIEHDDVRSLFNHSSDFVLGRKSAGTLRLSEDKRGISYEVDLPDTTWANDLAESIRRGDIRENSFAFFVGEGGDTWVQTETGLERTVTRATLKEVGPQPFAAYPQSTVDVRSLQATLERGRKCIGAHCRRGGQDPDVLLRELELDLDRRGRKGTGGRDPAELERELDSRSGPKADPVQRTRTRVYPSPSIYRGLLAHNYSKIKAVAYHESAHAVIGLLEGLCLGEVRFNWKGSPGYSWEFKGGKCEIKSGTQTSRLYVAGRCAEDLAGFRPELLDGWRAGDERQASKLTTRGTWVDRSDVRLTLTRHWSAVKALALRLMEVQRIDGPEAEQIILANLDANTRSRLRAAA